MRKILSFLLLIALTLSLTACGKPAADFFDDTLLQQCNLSGLPAPALENAQRDGNTLYCNLSAEDYADYARKVADYLKARSDIFHVGFLYSNGLEGDIFPYDVFTFLPSNYNYHLESHVFAFSATEEFDRYTALQNPIRVEIRREIGSLSDKFSYNTVISIQSQTERGARFEYCAAQHTNHIRFDYPIPGTSQIATISTCVYCGSTTRENFITDGQSYKITLGTGLQYIYRSNRVLDYCVSGQEVEISVKAVANGDAVILVNGQQIPRLREQDGTWIYGFAMPQQDITIDISIVTN